MTDRKSVEVVRTGGKGMNHLRLVGEEIPFCRMRPSPTFRVLRVAIPTAYPLPFDEPGYWCGSCTHDYHIMGCGDGKGPATAYCFEIDGDEPIGHRVFARGLEEIYMKDSRSPKPFVRIRMKPETMWKLYQVLARQFGKPE